VPTEETITVYPGGGGDYTTLAAAEAGERQDLVAADKALTFSIKSGGSFGTASFFVANWTTDATRTITIEAESGSEHNGTVDSSGVAHANESAAVILDLRVAYTYVRNLLILCTSGSSGANPVALGTSLPGSTVPLMFVENVICKLPASSSTAAPFSLRGSLQLVNCVGMGGVQGFHVEVAASGTNMILAGLVGSGFNRGFALTDADATVAVFNSYFHRENGGANSAWLITAGTVTAASNVATSDTTGPNAAYHNIDIDSTVFAGATDPFDFDPHLADEDSALYGEGADVSSIFGGIDYDYEDGTRTRWDIGADEFGVARDVVPDAPDGGDWRNIVPVYVPRRRGAGFFASAM
jgi:hypothetical protein